jgi:hypothetical protein
VTPGRPRAAAWLLAPALAAALAAGAPGAAAQPGLAPALRAETARAFRELARLRGMADPGPAPAVVVRTREERRRFILSELRRKYPAARLEAERRALVAWDLLPAGFDLPGFLADLVLEQAAAYYDPVGKVLVLANWLGPAAQREAVVHELVHALQDRQLDVDRFLAVPAGRSDEALARQALVEGEAVALTLELDLRRQQRSLELLPDVTALQRAILVSATGPLYARAPAFLRAALTFPYARGLGLVHHVARHRGWAEVPRLFADPPRSTAQVLRPERLLGRREDPLVVAVPDLGALAPGARPVLVDELGEFVLAEVLGDAARDVPLEAWRGDRYAVWDDGGVLALVARTAWLDEPAAEAAARALGRRLLRRHGPPEPAGPAAGLQAWLRHGRVDAVERRGREVLAVERVPAALLDGLRRAAWEPVPR